MQVGAPHVNAATVDHLAWPIFFSQYVWLAESGDMVAMLFETRATFQAI